MAVLVPFIIAVEGLPDEAVAKRLLSAAGACCRSVLGLRGKPWIDENAEKLVRAGRGSPVLVLRDLDRDGCVVDVSRRLDDRSGRFACVRIAKHAVESWLLADADALAEALMVARQNTGGARGCRRSEAMHRRSRCSE